MPPDTELLAARRGHLMNGYPVGDGMDHNRRGMGGLILGLYVRPPAGWQPAPMGNRRTVRLVVATDSQVGDSAPRMGYVLGEGGIGRYGPPLVLKRGEPTRIWVVNHMKEGTQVHWHGIELESPFDGVAGTSGVSDQRARMIAPGESTQVLVTPPRAGTFIYHTHLNDIHQLMRGLYGALVVLDSGQRWNPDSDLVFIAADNGKTKPWLNGGETGDTIQLHRGIDYRVRLINIAVFNATLRFQLTYRNAPMDWQTLAKDGADLPHWRRRDVEARQDVSVGETYDMQVQSPDTGVVALELRTLGGTLRGQQVIHFGP
jgi:FtsP/CotA-like multicopper oxidase with cupredoxin domain